MCGGVAKGAIKGGGNNGTQGIHGLGGFEEVKGHGPGGRGFGGVRVRKDGVDSRMVTAFGCVAGGTACADEGVAGWGEVSGADKARGKSCGEGGGEVVMINA